MLMEEPKEGIEGGRKEANWEQGFLGFFFKILFILFLDRAERREKEIERNINVWLPLMHPLPGTQPATQACGLTGNRTSDPVVCKQALNPPSPTSQGRNKFIDGNFYLQRLWVWGTWNKKA